MNPAISVIIATYKRPHLIGRALDSVAAQTLPPDEIIVIDDASGDDTGDVVALWSRANGLPVTFLEAETNGGAGAARNVAMRHARGDLLAFLDSDDAYRPHALETLRQPFQEGRKVAVAFADALQHGPGLDAPVPMMSPHLDMDRDTETLAPPDPDWRRLRDPQSVLLTTSIIPTCAALFTRRAAEAVGLMPEYRHGEDWLFWLKLTGQGPFLVLFDDVADIHRQGDNQTGAEHNARNSSQALKALLHLRRGDFAVDLSPANRERLETGIARKIGDMRYWHSVQGIGDYWRALGEGPARETGGRWRHLVRDPRSLARALAVSTGFL
ncbi:glycosyl transferase family 2 [Novosphingobium kunmingense]|uniref:Glycosyl transferase family 2 n=1 Tax=Novosphingobium kunmingense TaxID=1211806 RepID=A0A2N0H6I5_9SPHN|nr:glycosyltransferase family A protein [Novosphingobium kunmingense]PKB14545.1 glycosyl transferase family 2 [Novosphingobium kunmingense]